MQIQSGVLSPAAAPTHKTVRSTGRPIVISQLPAEIEQLLTPYLALCRPLLASQDTRTLFLTSRGEGQWGLPSAVTVFQRQGCWPAVGLGHVAFSAADAEAHLRVALDAGVSCWKAWSPPMQGLLWPWAPVLRQWNNKYFLSRDTSLVDSAVAAMPAWRARHAAEGSELS